MPSSDVCSRSEEHTSELQSHDNLVCRLLLEKKDRKSTRLNSSHTIISYAVFCLKKNATRSTDPRAACAPPVAARPATPSRPPGSARTKVAGLFFNDTATTEIYTLSLHDALPI